MSAFPKEQDTYYTMMGNRLAGLAVPSRGATTIEMWRAFIPAGNSTPPHTHDDEEVVFIVKGQGKLKIGDEVFDLVPEATAIIPAGAVHQIFSTDEEIDCVGAMPLGTPSRQPDGTIDDLPWRA